MKRLTGIQRIIRDFLIYCARRESVITYAELGGNVGKTAAELGENFGRTARGPWRTDLDAIRDDEIACGRPDLSLVVVSRKTGFPTMYKGRDFDPRDRDTVALYRGDLGRLFKFWGERRRGGAWRPDPCRRNGRAEIADDRDRSRRMAAIGRQEREDQAFIDAVTDWDWGDR